MSIQSINPATGQVLETFTAPTAADVERILANAHRAFGAWRDVPFATRTQHMQKAASILRGRKAEFARTMTLEMGKPIVQGEAEVEKCAWTCEYYAEHAQAMLAEQPRETDASRSFVRFDPLGVVLAVMPWNFPFWQVFRFAAPALMAGNAAVLKHASNVPRCALQIEEVFRDAGFPPGLFATLLIGSSAVGGLIADPRIVAVTLTGSEHAGIQVAERAGRELKKTVLELGGSDPFIVLADADVGGGGASGGRRAADQQRPELHRRQALHRGRGGGRHVHRRASPTSSARARWATRSPARPRWARRPASISATICTARSRSRSSAAPSWLLGGEIPSGPRRVLSAHAADRGGQGHAGFRRGDLRSGRRRDPRQATRRTPCVWPTTRPSGSARRCGRRTAPAAERLAAQIEAGAVFVNGLVKSDPRLPFGGIKRSGYGRELSEYGIREFVNIKSVWIA